MSWVSRKSGHVWGGVHIPGLGMALIAPLCEHPVLVLRYESAINWKAQLLCCCLQGVLTCAQRTVGFYNSTECDCSQVDCVSDHRHDDRDDHSVEARIHKFNEPFQSIQTAKCLCYYYF